jgi:hypothetical protein
MLSASDIGIIEIKKNTNKNANISLLFLLISEKELIISEKELKNFE